MHHSLQDNSSNSYTSEVFYLQKSHYRCLVFESDNVHRIFQNFNKHSYVAAKFVHQAMHREVHKKFIKKYDIYTHLQERTHQLTQSLMSCNIHHCTVEHSQLMLNTWQWTRFNAPPGFTILLEISLLEMHIFQYLELIKYSTITRQKSRRWQIATLRPYIKLI